MISMIGNFRPVTSVPTLPASPTQPGAAQANTRFNSFLSYFTTSPASLLHQVLDGSEYTCPNRQADDQRCSVGEDRNPIPMNIPIAFMDPHGGKAPCWRCAMQLSSRLFFAASD